MTATLATVPVDPRRARLHHARRERERRRRARAEPPPRLRPLPRLPELRRSHRGRRDRRDDRVARRDVRPRDDRRSRRRRPSCSGSTTSIRTFPTRRPSPGRTSRRRRPAAIWSARAGSDLVATAHVRIDLGGAGERRARRLRGALRRRDRVHRLSDRAGCSTRSRRAGCSPRLRRRSPPITARTSGEDGLYYEHGPSVHDASLRVPLVVAGPGIEPRVDRAIARLEDLAPTLLALARVPARGVAAVRRRGSLVAPARAAATRAPAIRGRRERRRAAARDLHLPRLAVIPAIASASTGARFSLCVDPGGEPRLYDHVADPFLKQRRERRAPGRRGGAARGADALAGGSARASGRCAPRATSWSSGRARRWMADRRSTTSRRTPARRATWRWSGPSSPSACAASSTPPSRRWRRRRRSSSSRASSRRCARWVTCAEAFASG